MTADEVNLGKLSTGEKLRLMEAIWNDLLRSNAEVRSPGWHGQVLQERDRMIQSGEESFVDWETAKQKLREQLSR